jgi:hypothetical protein
MIVAVDEDSKLGSVEKTRDVENEIIPLGPSCQTPPCFLDGQNII